MPKKNKSPAEGAHCDAYSMIENARKIGDVVELLE